MQRKHSIYNTKKAKKSTTMQESGDGRTLLTVTIHTLSLSLMALLSVIAGEHPGLLGFPPKQAITHRY